MKQLTQNNDARSSDEFVGGRLLLEINDTLWSDIANSVTLSDLANTTIGDKPIELDVNYLAPDHQYWISAFPLESNITVGPTREGAFLMSNSGTQLYLSDPQLPGSVWAGPVSVAVIGAETSAPGLLSLSDVNPKNHEDFRFQVWPFSSGVYDLYGYIRRGERLRVLKLTTPDNRLISGWSRGSDLESISESQESNDHLRRDTTNLRLVDRIRGAYRKAELDSESSEVAKRAVGDACAIAGRELANFSPSVMLSEDGVVMLQWRKGSEGVLLIFTGDGTGSFSIKRVGGRYSRNSEEFSISGPLPDKVKAAILDFA